MDSEKVQTHISYFNFRKKINKLSGKEKYELNLVKNHLTDTCTINKVVTIVRDNLTK